MNPEGTDFMDIVILENDGWTKKDYPALSELAPRQMTYSDQEGELFEPEDNILK